MGLDIVDSFPEGASSCKVLCSPAPWLLARLLATGGFKVNTWFASDSKAPVSSCRIRSNSSNSSSSVFSLRFEALLVTFFPLLLLTEP